MMSVKNTIVGG
jgi:Origin recognition complex (ORC) subunit 5 C-terminus